MYVPPAARFSHLLSLPEGDNIGKAINEAMKSVEADNVDLKGVLPRHSRDRPGLNRRPSYGHQRGI